MATVYQIPDSRYTYSGYLLLVLLLAWVTFGSLAEHSFEMDDFNYLKDASTSLENPSFFWSTEKSLPGRPVTELLFLITQAICRNNPGLYHLFMVGLHVVASLLLAVVFYRWGIDLELSLLSSLFFLMNVAHFRAIHWISCLAYPLSLIFCLLTLLCYRKALESDYHHWIYATGILLILSILSHGSAVFLPLFCFYLALQQKKSRLTIIRLVGPLMIISLISVMALHSVYPNASQEVHIASVYHLDLIRVFTKLSAYLGSLFVLAFWFPMNFNLNPWETWTGLFVLGWFLILWRLPVLKAWIMYTLVLLLPFIIYTQEQSIGSRYLYLASAGSSLILAWLLRWSVQRIGQRIPFRVKQIAFGVVIVCLIGICLISLKRAEALTYYLSGTYYLEQGNAIDDPEIKTHIVQTGMKQLNRSIVQDPRNHFFVSAKTFKFGHSLFIQETKYLDTSQWYILKAVSSFLNKTSDSRQQAEVFIQKALETAENRKKVHVDAGFAFYQLAEFYHRSGQYQDADKIYHRVLAYQPDHSNALMGLGNVYRAQNQNEKAGQTYKRVLQIQANQDDALYGLGLIALKENRLDEAEKHFTQALEIRPESRIFYFMALVSTRKGALDQATQYLHLAHEFPSKELGIKPSTIAEVFRKVGESYYEQGNYASAVASFQEAIQLAPEDPETRMGLAQAVEKLDRMEAAETCQ